MVTITIKRVGKLEKPMGLGEGRISEGTLTKDWGTTATAIRAGSLKLRSITNVQLTPGTPLFANVYARVVEPGSVDNTVRILAELVQRGRFNQTTGAEKTTTFDTAFTGSPDIAISPGTPSTDLTGIYAGSAVFPYIRRKYRGSFVTYGTPGWGSCQYIAIGPGSFPLNYVAIGD